MMYDFYFIHGWGFDKTFWRPLKKKIKVHKICRSTTCLDLNFFSKEKRNKEQLDSISDNNIFIVHSYGLNWFLKKNLGCKLLINFFGAPDFINLQKSPNLVKKRIIMMNEQLNINPERVLRNFYKICNVNFENKKTINVQKLSRALSELRDLNFSKQLKKLNFKIHSIYSYKDKVLNIDEESINYFKNKKHDITIFNNYDHGFPETQPEICFKLIKEILRNI